MTPSFKAMTKKDSTELIVYQISEVKNLVENLRVELNGYRESTDKKIDNYREAVDKRLKDIELNQVAQETLNKNQSTMKPIDWQKIVLAFIALVSTVVGLAFGFNQRGM